MATSSRQSAVPSLQRTLTANELPPYEPLRLSLNAAGLQALKNLAGSARLGNLEAKFASAQKLLSESAGELNDRVTDAERLAKRRRANESQGADDEDEAAAAAQLTERVETMTTRMEESMRRLIDCERNLHATQASVREAADQVQICSSQAAEIPSTRSPRRQTAAADGLENEDTQASEIDASVGDFDPTDPAGSGQMPQAPLGIFRTHRERLELDYVRMPHSVRYAENDNYREFRRTIHDARYPNDEVPLSHHSEWFTSDNVAAPGVTYYNKSAGQDQEDDDIAISRASISIKCPLTLRDFEHPLTSRKCPHSFEAEAITEMIRSSTQRANGDSGQRAVQCPVPGCTEMLTQADLHEDAVMLRRIRRIQQFSRLDDSRQSVGPGGRNVHQVLDIDDDYADMDDEDDMQPPRATPVTKLEKSTGA